MKEFHTVENWYFNCVQFMCTSTCLHTIKECVLHTINPMVC